MGDLASLRAQVEDSGGQAALVLTDAGVSKQSFTPNYYCLSSSHDPRMLTEDRFFYFDDSKPGCPVCPLCNKEVNAQLAEYDAKGRPQIPSGLKEIAGRIGERV